MEMMTSTQLKQDVDVTSNSNQKRYNCKDQIQHNLKDSSNNNSYNNSCKQNVINKTNKPGKKSQGSSSDGGVDTGPVAFKPVLPDPNPRPIVGTTVITDSTNQTFPDDEDAHSTMTSEEHVNLPPSTLRRLTEQKQQNLLKVQQHLRQQQQQSEGSSSERCGTGESRNASVSSEMELEGSTTSTKKVQHAYEQGQKQSSSSSKCSPVSTPGSSSYDTDSSGKESGYLTLEDLEEQFMIKLPSSYRKEFKKAYDRSSTKTDTVELTVDNYNPSGTSLCDPNAGKNIVVEKCERQTQVYFEKTLSSISSDLQLSLNFQQVQQYQHPQLQNLREQQMSWQLKHQQQLVKERDRVMFNNVTKKLPFDNDLDSELNDVSKEDKEINCDDEDDEDEEDDDVFLSDGEISNRFNDQFQINIKHESNKNDGSSADEDDDAFDDISDSNKSNSILKNADETVRMNKHASTIAVEENKRKADNAEMQQSSDVDEINHGTLKLQQLQAQSQDVQQFIQSPKHLSSQNFQTEPKKHLAKKKSSYAIMISPEQLKEMNLSNAMSQKYHAQATLKIRPEADESRNILHVVKNVDKENHNKNSMITNGSDIKNPCETFCNYNNDNESDDDNDNEDKNYNKINEDEMGGANYVYTKRVDAVMPTAAAGSRLHAKMQNISRNMMKQGKLQRNYKSDINNNNLHVRNSNIGGLNNRNNNINNKDDIYMSWEEVTKEAKHLGINLNLPKTRFGSSNINEDKNKCNKDINNNHIYKNDAKKCKERVWFSFPSDSEILNNSVLDRSETIGSTVKKYTKTRSKTPTKVRFAKNVDNIVDPNSNLMATDGKFNLKKLFNPSKLKQNFKIDFKSEKLKTKESWFSKKEQTPIENCCKCNKSCGSNSKTRNSLKMLSGQSNIDNYLQGVSTRTKTDYADGAVLNTGHNNGVKSSNNHHDRERSHAISETNKEPNSQINQDYCQHHHRRHRNHLQQQLQQDKHEQQQQQQNKQMEQQFMSRISINATQISGHNPGKNYSEVMVDKNVMREMQMLELRRQVRQQEEHLQMQSSSHGQILSNFYLFYIHSIGM
ncbi:hypothetical protein HELRODRAFT_160543 [Helobdella robusta]|uniref:Uncharacterized protein n=1 Tax=Helobdella robusta TaxID=6412 RepID=T1EQE4_HELRO|nr:hypothetical protein HELRODRAFT_160543 [Helobdella robusta]ESO06376.1 hypothetical protein HELRODRAFT_160543 [Helobdella robusta]